MNSKNLFSGFVLILIAGTGFRWVSSVYSQRNFVDTAVIAASVFIIALITSSAIKIANPCDKEVVRYLGKFQSIRGLR